MGHQINLPHSHEERWNERKLQIEPADGRPAALNCSAFFRFCVSNIPDFCEDA